MARSEMSMKLIIDTNRNRVIFAEADNNCVDFLVCIMSLPMATMVRLLKKHGMVGCLSNVYESIENLDSKYLKPDQQKDAVLHSFDNDKIEEEAFEALFPCYIPKVHKYYLCSCNTSPVLFVNSSNPVCKICKGRVIHSRDAEIVPPKKPGFVKEEVVYMVTDDLVIKPTSAISTVHLLKQYGVKDVGALKEKEVCICLKEALMLLKTSMYSNNVLTKVFMKDENSDEESDDVFNISYLFSRC